LGYKFYDDNNDAPQLNEDDNDMLEDCILLLKLGMEVTTQHSSSLFVHVLHFVMAIKYHVCVYFVKHKTTI